MKYVKLFDLISQYQAYVNGPNMILPNVSVCKDNDYKVFYNPIVVTPEGDALEGAKILCKYNVNDISSPVTLYFQIPSSGLGSGSGSDEVDVPIFSSMEVDGVEQEVANEYTFDTTGEHTVLFTLLEGETSIGNYAFYECSSLTNVTIGNSITSIGFNAFDNCSGLTSITCNATTAPTIQSDTFYNIKTGGTLTVPAGSTGYDVWMRTDNYYLGQYNWTKVVTPEGDALEGAKILCKYNVSDISSPVTLYIQIPNSGSGSGSGSDEVAAPIFSSMEVDGVEQEVANEYTFDTTGEHTVLFTLLEGETSISNGAFDNCSGLTSVTIGNSVTSISDSVFNNCTGLTNIIIPNSVTSIGYATFSGCSGLTSVTIPNSVTSIGYYAFSQCYGLTNVTIGNSITSIGFNAFDNCSGLTSITCNATIAPIIKYNTFNNIKTGGTLTVPAGSTGYDVWMGTDDYYLGHYNWTKVEA